jgi:hypothetical protein
MDDPTITLQTEPIKPARKRGTNPAKSGESSPAVSTPPPPHLPDQHTSTQSDVPPRPTEAKSRQRPHLRTRPLTPAPADANSGASEGPPRPALTRDQAVQILVDRANAGSKSALVSLRTLLDRCPEIWIQVGDLAQHAELNWLELISGGDHMMIESVKRQLTQLKTQLAGSAPTPLESLLVESVTTTWLAQKHAELGAAKSGTSSLGEANLRLRRAESAQKRHLASIKALAMLRALVPRGLNPLNSTGQQESHDAP